MKTKSKVIIYKDFIIHNITALGTFEIEGYSTRAFVSIKAAKKFLNSRLQK